MKNKRYFFLMSLISMLVFSACGIQDSDKENTESTQRTEESQETESEFYREIADATEILTKTWDMYAQEDRFKIMGGHFETAVVGLPAEYDLTQTRDLVQMYCVPEGQVENLDDAATMVDLYNAGRFMAGVYHVTDAEFVKDFGEGIQSQFLANEWHGEKPEKLLVMKIDEQYVVSVSGRASLVNGFKQKLEAVYQEMATVMIEENIFQ